ncbi:MAG: energy transducer TonB [Flavobacteriales bacterium]|nr:energy transducer TonB [Flavobacteriales bacterium]
MKMKNDSLEKKRPLLLTAGFTFAVSMALVSFEWRTPYYGEVQGPPKNDDIIYEYDSPPVTLREVEEPTERPEPPKLETDQFDIVDEIDPDVVETAPEDLVFEPIDLPTDATFTPKIEEKDVDEDEIFITVEEMPKYPGGDFALLSYLAEKTKYPRAAIDNNITGTVYVYYVVDKNGKVTDVEVARSVHPILDKEAVRVVKTLSGYSAGKQRGIPVKVKYTVPIRFELK